MPLPLSYNYRNLFVRKLSTGLTFLLVAVVVFVLAVLLSFAEGIRASLKATGSPRNLIVLKPGSTAESTSIIPQDEINRVVQAPGIAQDASGRPMVSYETCVQTSFRRTDGTIANVAIRGVDAIALELHEEVILVDGRRFEPGSEEAIVGQAARQRYPDLQLGNEVALGRLSNRKFKIVGVFEARGGALESEVWASRSIVADAFNRRVDSSAVLRLQDPDLAQAAIDYINGPAVNLDAKTETDYYEELSRTTRQIVILTSILIGIMGIGAVFAVANTMYAAVDSRRREIAMLRTIGFSRRAIMAAFVIESLLICSAACAVGLGASLLFHGQRQDFLSDATFTVLAYELKITPVTIGSALGMAVAVGVVGAMAPAVRAARTQVIEALRKA